MKLIQIKVDNGTENSGVRTQFLKRMVEFADETGKSIQLLYFPPYHSKYNPIERCWGILEQHWNGDSLNIDKDGQPSRIKDFDTQPTIQQQGCPSLSSFFQGAILRNVETLLAWAQSMTWKGLKPLVNLNQKIYEKGISLNKKTMKEIEMRKERNPLLPKWDILIRPS